MAADARHPPIARLISQRLMTDVSRFKDLKLPLGKDRFRPLRNSISSFRVDMLPRLPRLPAYRPYSSHSCLFFLLQINTGLGGKRSLTARTLSTIDAIIFGWCTTTEMLLKTNCTNLGAEYRSYNTRQVVVIGADIGTIKLLIFWSSGARGEPRSRVHSWQYLTLPGIRVGILLIAPFSNVIQPSNRIAWIIRRKGFGVCVVAVVIRA